MQNGPAAEVIHSCMGILLHLRIEMGEGLSVAIQ